MSAARVTKVRESLLWHEAFGASKRHQRQARKWPWAWWCTECDDAYGAAKTQPEAQCAADEHELKVHGDASQTSLVDPAQGQTSPSKGDQVT
jgi:hypothetical protein